MSAPALPGSHASAARALPLLVALSGAAALVYESLWLRSFGLIFGGTTSAVAMVLAVFMGGLALGSALVARRPVADPLLAYARLELLIAAAALVTLPLLRVLPWAYGAIVARGAVTAAAEHAGIALLAALVLLPPTVLLGATVPLAVEFLSRSGVAVHASFGRLYLLNTLGGALGATLAPFALVPALGVRGSVVFAAALSLLVGGVALRFARERGPIGARQPESGPGKPSASTAAGALGPALAFASGAATFGLEVLWTRSYALVIGSTVYAFGLVLLAVLLGIAAGSAAYAAWRHSIVRPARTAGLLFIGAGLAALAGAWAIGRLPVVLLWALGQLPLSFGVQQLAFLALCLATLLPVGVALGVTFPLLLHLALAPGGGAQRAAGRLYAWNTAGAIAGALAADLVLVPRLGVQPPFLVFAALLVAGGTWALASAARRDAHVGPLAALAFVAAACVVAPRFKPWDPVLVTSGVHRYGLQWTHQLDSPARLGTWLREQRTLVFYREGPEAVVAVSEARDSGRRFLSVNGKTDAGSGTLDVVTQKFIAHVPMLLHPDPHRALVIGWGSGATVATAALYPLDRVECVEIEPAVFAAAPFFDSLSGAIRRDPRFRIVFRDGRNHLLRSRERWDVIVSEPSNPWISGVSNLFTQEFYQAARARLSPRGVFGQWFHYYNMEPADVKIELATFAAVFPYASVWTVPSATKDGQALVTGDLLLVGSEEPHALDWNRLSWAFEQEALAKDLKSTRVLSDEVAVLASYAFGRQDLLRYVADATLFPRGTPLNTDDKPWIEFRAPRRNVLPPAEVPRLAQELHRQFGEASSEELPPVTGHPGVRAGGRAVAPLHVALSERWMLAGLQRRARRGFERALVLDPGNEWALESLGSLAIDGREWARAEQLHRGLLVARPDDVDARLRLVAVLARQSKWTEARRMLRSARAMDPRAAVDPQLVRYIEAQAGS